jgi:pyridoxine 5-phosphate synthase
VPEKREERTTEGGLDPAASGLGATIERLRGAGIRVSLFIGAEPDVIRAAARLKPHMIELHTGEYCNARGEAVEKELGRLARGAELAASLGLRVAAGHGLDYPNVGPVAEIAEIEELNIGHSIVARAVLVGLERAVMDMLAAIDV